MLIRLRLFWMAFVLVLVGLMAVPENLEAQRRGRRTQGGSPAVRGGHGVRGGGVMYRTSARRATSRRQAGLYSGRYVGSRRRHRSHQTTLGRHGWASVGRRVSFGSGLSLGYYYPRHFATYGGHYYSSHGYYPARGGYDGYIATYPEYRVGYDVAVSGAFDLSGRAFQGTGTAGASLEAARLELLIEELLEEDRNARRDSAAKPDARHDRPTLKGESMGEPASTAPHRAAVQRGDAAFEAGDYAAAREDYIRAIVEAGDDASSRIALGLAEFALGHYGDAARAVRWGAARSPGLAQSAFDLRQAYGQQESLGSHRQRLASFVKAHPDDADALFLLGFVRLFSGERLAGLADLRAYLRMPEHDPAVAAFVEQAGLTDVRETD